MAETNIRPVPETAQPLKRSAFLQETGMFEVRR